MRPDNHLLRAINAQRGDRPWLDFVLACLGFAAVVVAVIEVAAKGAL